MKSKIVGLFAAVMVALMIAGFAYAHWEQTLYIQGTVETGEYLVGFESAWDNDDGVDPGYDKDVGNTTAWLDVWKGVHIYPYNGPTVDLYEKLVIEITNAYPSYTSTVYFEIGNGGTIPAMVTGAKVVKVDGSPVEIELPKGTDVQINMDDDEDVDLTLRFDGPEDQQIDPCETKEFSLTIHVEQGAEQGATYSFKIEIYTIQWNLAP